MLRFLLCPVTLWLAQSAIAAPENCPESAVDRTAVPTDCVQTANDRYCIHGEQQAEIRDSQNRVLFRFRDQYLNSALASLQLGSTSALALSLDGNSGTGVLQRLLLAIDVAGEHSVVFADSPQVRADRVADLDIKLSSEFLGHCLTAGKQRGLKFSREFVVTSDLHERGLRTDARARWNVCLSIKDPDDHSVSANEEIASLVEKRLALCRKSLLGREFANIALEADTICYGISEYLIEFGDELRQRPSQ